MSRVRSNELEELLEEERQLQSALDSDQLDREHREFEGPYVSELEQEANDRFDDLYSDYLYDDPWEWSVYELTTAFKP